MQLDKSYVGFEEDEDVKTLDHVTMTPSMLWPVFEGKARYMAAPG